MNKFAYKLDLQGPEGRSGYNYENLIAEIAAATGCENYLELGLYYGTTFIKMCSVVPKCFGVDIELRFEIPTNASVYVGTTDSFFASNTQLFNMIFIDANHQSDFVVRDFENSLKSLSEFGFIFLHDTDPSDLLYAQPGYCNDAYKIIDYIHNTHPELNEFTFPITEAGLTIVQRKKDRRISRFIDFGTL